MNAKEVNNVFLGNVCYELITSLPDVYDTKAYREIKFFKLFDFLQREIWRQALIS